MSRDDLRLNFGKGAFTRSNGVPNGQHEPQRRPGNGKRPKQRRDGGGGKHRTEVDGSNERRPRQEASNKISLSPSVVFAYNAIQNMFGKFFELGLWDTTRSEGAPLAQMQSVGFRWGDFLLLHINLCITNKQRRRREKHPGIKITRVFGKLNPSGTEDEQKEAVGNWMSILFERTGTDESMPKGADRVVRIIDILQHGAGEHVSLRDGLECAWRSSGGSNSGKLTFEITGEALEYMRRWI